MAINGYTSFGKMDIIKMTEGKLITLEGINGIGKTYYFNFLREALKDEETIIKDFNNWNDGNYKIHTVI